MPEEEEVQNRRASKPSQFHVAFPPKAFVPVLMLFGQVFWLALR